MSGRTGIWGKPEWKKTQYKTGKIIFHNATHVNQEWTPNGQQVKLTIGSTKVTLAPGERYAFQPRDNGTLTIVAKPQLSTMRSGKATIKDPLSYEDHHIEILAGGGSGFGLTFRGVSAH
jgi:hypothetical protein